MSIKVRDSNNNLKAVQDVFVGNQRVYEIIAQNQLKYYYGGKYKNLTDFTFAYQYRDAQPYDPQNNIGLTKHMVQMGYTQPTSLDITGQPYSFVLLLESFSYGQPINPHSRVEIYNTNNPNRDKIALIMDSAGTSFGIFNYAEAGSMFQIHNDNGFGEIYAWIFPHGNNYTIQVEWYAPASKTPNFSEFNGKVIDFIPRINKLAFSAGTGHEYMTSYCNYIIRN